MFLEFAVAREDRSMGGLLCAVRELFWGTTAYRADIVCVVGLEYAPGFVFEEVMRGGLGGGGGAWLTLMCWIPALRRSRCAGW